MALAAVGSGAFLVYAQPQPLLPEATAALASDSKVTVEVVGRDLVLRASGSTPSVGLILYPGGKVPPAAYAPAAREIAAESGALVAIVDVPFNFAVFDIDAADRIIRANPSIAAWVLGGHSLGGAMAAQYAASHPGAVDGLALWASYSAADLSASGVEVVSVYGSLDAGVATVTSAANRARLPADATFVEIAGGNHEQMGSYTGQPNDPPATITRADQQARVVAVSVELVMQLTPG